jgi:biotin synthase
VTRNEILRWLREDDPRRLSKLYSEADRVRAENVGDGVHLRGLIEISNCCTRSCGYCGLRAPNRAIRRYRMEPADILECVRAASFLGYGTVVVQSGEDGGCEWMPALIRRIKEETALAVTLSLGERSPAEFTAWREAGADRYLLRFETSDRALFDLIHPSREGQPSDRIAMLKLLREIGYEIGGGVMIGLPGQSWESLARDIELFRELDLDMIGVGPYIPHPATPLATGEWRHPIAPSAQVPNTEEMVYKVVALARLVCPQANIPSTTALATINTVNGRELGLMRGANVVMPNLTPPRYRSLYEIYPNKACMTETPADCSACLRGRIRRIGRIVASGPGGRRREAYA